MKKLYYTIASSVAVVLGSVSISHAAEFQVSITNLTPGMHFTPVIVAAHAPAAQMFSAGTPAIAELQAIAEGGDTGGMNELLSSIGASIANGDGLIAPGANATFTVSSSDSNSVLSIASMLLPTNDGFVGLNSVALPEGETGASHTYYALGYDAGTEANDELVGSGAPGEPGFPAPPPVVATGTGTGGTGIQGRVEGFVHVHKNMIGDLDSTGGVSDTNSAVHGWLNPVARVVVTKMNDDDGVNGTGPGPVPELSSAVYSSTAVEIFWDAATSSDSFITGYEVSRDGELLATLDGRSYFDDSLTAETTYTYQVRAVDANDAVGEYSSVTVTTNAN